METTLKQVPRYCCLGKVAEHIWAFHTLEIWKLQPGRPEDENKHQAPVDQDNCLSRKTIFFSLSLTYFQYVGAISNAFDHHVRQAFCYRRSLRCSHCPYFWSWSCKLEKLPRAIHHRTWMKRSQQGILFLQVQLNSTFVPWLVLASAKNPTVHCGCSRN